MRLKQASCKHKNPFFSLELIVTAGGENIAPIPIEENIKMEVPLIATCMVIGDKKKFLSCLLTCQVRGRAHISCIYTKTAIFLLAGNKFPQNIFLTFSEQRTATKSFNSAKIAH